MSRDPEDGKAKDPQSLHKYLYAGGDPVNRIDPMGREDLMEYLVAIKKVLISPAMKVMMTTAAAACFSIRIRDKTGNYYVDELDKEVTWLFCTTIAGASIVIGVASLI